MNFPRLFISSGQCKPPSLCIGLTDQEEDANECELKAGETWFLLHFFTDTIFTDFPPPIYIGEAGSDPALGTCCSDLTDESQGSAGDTLAAGEEEKRREEEEKGEEAEVDNVSLGDVDSLLGERYFFVIYFFLLMMMMLLLLLLLLLFLLLLFLLLLLLPVNVVF